LIAYLEGILAEKKPTSAIVDVNGVGYSVFVPFSTYQRLPEVNQKVKLLTHTHVREDAFTLFGFVTLPEKELFGLLLGVNGIGPKSALGILSSIATEDFYRCIIDEDLDLLTKISGIGKKTAQRLIVELKEKLQKSDVLVGKPMPSAKTADAIEQALAALMSLGYDRIEAREAVQKVNSGKKKLSVEELVKQALSSTAKAKLVRI
jgi:holliday junction DNA helicase RuvA